MYFGARIDNPKQFKIFLDNLDQLRLYTVQIVVRITETNVFFIAPLFQTKGKLFLYTELSKEGMFCEFDMQGINDEYNEIFLECDLPTLLNALKTYTFPNQFDGGFGSRSCGFRLKANEQYAYIEVEIEQPTDMGQYKNTTFDVPVRVISKRKWIHYKEPESGTAELFATLPSAQCFKKVVSRFKLISSHLELKGKTDGTIQLRASNNYSDVKSMIKASDVRDAPMENDVDETEHISSATTVSAQVLWHILNLYTTENSILRLFIQHQRSAGVILQSQAINVVALFPHQLP